jgi:hypothetical protein
VLAPLARALRLTDDERAHLFRVAGQAEPLAGQINRHVPPGVQRVLDRLSDVPVVVMDAAWYVVAANPLAVALVGDASSLPRPRDRNIAWRHFTGASSRFARDDEEDARMQAEAVADRREALGRYPDDAPLRELIADLQDASPRFAELWAGRAQVAQRSASRKTVVHPEVGPITLDCDVLSVRGSDLRLIVYTAAPGTADANALTLLAAIGLQTFS